MPEQNSLSETQQWALKSALYSVVSDNYYIPINKDLRESTLKSLVNKGFLNPKMHGVSRYWLTEKGLALKNHLDNPARSG